MSWIIEVKTRKGEYNQKKVPNKRKAITIASAMKKQMRFLSIKVYNEKSNEIAFGFFAMNEKGANNEIHTRTESNN